MVNKITLLYQQEAEIGEYFSLTMLHSMLALNNVKVERKHIQEIHSIKDSYVILVKFISPIMGKILRENGNYIILDVVDLLAHMGDGNVRMHHYVHDCAVNKLLVRQKHTMNLLGEQFTTYIPFHYDCRLNNIEPTPHDFSAQRISFPYTDAGGMGIHNQYPNYFDTISIENQVHSDFNVVKQIHEMSMKNNFYFSVRSKNSLDYWFKPGTKVAAASAMNRNIITNTDMSLTEILPADYPYIYTDEDYTTFPDFYETKIRNPNRDEYSYGLECMRAIKEATNIYNQYEHYMKLFIYD